MKSYIFLLRFVFLRFISSNSRGPTEKLCCQIKFSFLSSVQFSAMCETLRRDVRLDGGDVFDVVILHTEIKLGRFYQAASQKQIKEGKKRTAAHARALCERGPSKQAQCDLFSVFT